MTDEPVNKPAIDNLWDYSDPVASEARFQDLVASPAAVHDLQYRAEVLTQVARAQGLQGKFKEAHVTLDEAETYVRADTPVLRVRCDLERGRAYNSAGQPEKAVPFFERAWAHAGAHGLDFYAVDAAHMLAIALPPEGQLEWSRKGIAAAEASADPRARNWLGPLYNNLGWTLHDARRYEEALDLFTKAVAWREDQGSEPEIRIAKWAVARTLRSLGRHDKALDMQRAIKAELQAAGEEDGYVDEELGECLLALGRADEARPHFAEAYRLLSQDDWLKDAEPERIERLRALGAE